MENQAGWFVSTILFLLILAPLGAVLIQVILPGVFLGNVQFGHFDLLLEVFKRPLWQASLGNSLILAITTAILGTVLGTLLATLRSHWDFPTAKWLDTSVWILFIMPSFIFAQGWILFASYDGIAANVLGSNIVNSFIFQPAGLIFIMTLAKFPVAYLTVQAALKWSVEDYSHAARLSGASKLRTWMTIQLPLSFPAIGSGFLLVFMDTIGDFGLPAAISTIYRFPTLPYAIYSAIYTSPIRFDMAGVLSFYLVLIILIAILLHTYIMKKSRFDGLTAKAIVTKPNKLGHSRYLFSLTNLIFLFVVIGIPIGSTVFVSFVFDPSNGLVTNNLTFEHYIRLFAFDSLFLESLLRSLKVAMPASLAGLALSVCIAYVSIFSTFKFKTFLNTASLISLAVPGVVLGIGYILFYNQRWLEPIGLLLYGKFSILIIAAVAGAIPIVTRIIIGTMSTIPRTMLDVAQLQGISLLGRIRTILYPICRSAFITGALTAFGVSMFDLAMNTILFPSGQFTLPVMINKAFEDFQFGYASAATIVAGIFVTTVIVVVNALTTHNVRKRLE